MIKASQNELYDRFMDWGRGMREQTVGYSQNLYSCPIANFYRDLTGEMVRVGEKIEIGFEERLLFDWERCIIEEVDQMEWGQPVTGEKILAIGEMIKNSSRQ